MREREKGGGGMWETEKTRGALIRRHARRWKENVTDSGIKRVREREYERHKERERERRGKRERGERERGEGREVRQREREGERV